MIYLFFFIQMQPQESSISPVPIDSNEERKEKQVKKCDDIKIKTTGF